MNVWTRNVFLFLYEFVKKTLFRDDWWRQADIWRKKWCSDGLMKEIWIFKCKTQFVNAAITIDCHRIELIMKFQAHSWLYCAQLYNGSMLHIPVKIIFTLKKINSKMPKIHAVWFGRLVRLSRFGEILQQTN